MKLRLNATEKVVWLFDSFFASPQSDHCLYPIFCNYCNLVSFPALINFLCCFLQIPLMGVRYDLYALQNLNGMFRFAFYFNLIKLLKNAVEISIEKYEIHGDIFDQNMS